MKNPLKTYGLFGWNYLHLMSHPWKIVSESYYHTKWFIQRGWRGYSDSDVWSLDYYLATWMPKALCQLRRKKLGHPIGMTTDGWQTRLRIMEEGFIEAKNISDMKYNKPRDVKSAQARINRGLTMFQKHFMSLWD